MRPTNQEVITIARYFVILRDPKEEGKAISQRATWEDTRVGQKVRGGGDVGKSVSCVWARQSKQV